MNKICFVGISLLLAFLSLNFQVINNTEQQVKKLTAIAKEYKSFEKSKKSRIVVTDSNKYKWTVALCTYLGKDKMGFYFHRDSVHFSKANSLEALHGNKLYQLYVKDREAYYNYNFIKSQPTGQIIVKETWNIREVDSTEKNIIKLQNANDGKWYTPGSVSQLFIMYKEGVNKENDNGWIYGIVDIEKGIDNIQVLSNGKLSNCVGCHQNTKYDRIFGRHY